MEILLKLILAFYFINSVFTLSCDFYVDDFKEEVHNDLTNIIKENKTLPDNVKIPVTESDPEEFSECEKQNPMDSLVPGFDNIPMDGLGVDRTIDITGCVYSQRTYKVLKMRNIHNELKKVTDGRTYYAITTAKCLSESAACQKFGEVCQCAQHYKLLTLKVYEEFEDEAIKTDKFYYPSECLCEKEIPKKSTDHETLNVN